MLKRIYVCSCSRIDNRMRAHSLVTSVVSGVPSLAHACALHLPGRLKFPPDNYVVDGPKAIHIRSEVLGRVSSAACELGPEGVVSVGRAGGGFPGLSGRGAANGGT